MLVIHTISRGAIPRETTVYLYKRGGMGRKSTAGTVTVTSKQHWSSGIVAKSGEIFLVVQYYVLLI